MGVILYGEQRKHDTGAIVVVDEKGDFAGVLTPHHVVLGLLNEHDPSEAGATEEVFLHSVEDHLGNTVLDVLPATQPTVSPSAPLAQLIRLAAEGSYECIPVIEEGRVEGLVYITDIFKAAASIALNPETDGILLEDE